VTTVAVDRDPLATEALVVTRVLDAASGLPRAVQTATTQVPHAWARVATGSYLVLSGRPELVVPELATQAYQLDSALGFADRAPLALEFTLPAGTALPYRPAAIPVELPPVSLQGTVTQEAYPHGPIDGAAISVAATAGPPALLALRTPLSVDHPSAASVHSVTVTPAAPATTLSEAVPQGAATLTLTSLAGCAAGAALVLGQDIDSEHAIISAVEPATSQVVLTAPLRRSRPVLAPARALTIAVAGATSALARGGEAGDGMLELTGAVTVVLVQIDGPVPELRATGAVSDPDGHWQLDGVRAIGQLAVTVTAAGFLTNGLVTYDVDYRHPNLIDLRLTV
jgi:hypothetical protein